MRIIKSFKLFESSSDDINEILSTVKDMLLELDFLDIETRCELVPYLKVGAEDKINRFGDKGVGYQICITLSKPAVKIGDNYKASFTWSDISEVVESVIDFLKEEGFLYRPDKGTLSYGGVPIISSAGSQQYNTIRSRLEMWFVE